MVCVYTHTHPSMKTEGDLNNEGEREMEKIHVYEKYDRNFMID